MRKDNFLSPTTKVITPFTVWKEIAAGRISGSQAMMKKLYRVEGDFDVMLNWGKYFGSGNTKQNAEKSYSAKKDKGTTLMLTLIPWITFWIAAAIDSYTGAFVSIGVCALTEVLFFRFRKTIYDVISSFCMGCFVYHHRYPDFFLNGNTDCSLSCDYQ